MAELFECRVKSNGLFLHEGKPYSNGERVFVSPAIFERNENYLEKIGKETAANTAKTNVESLQDLHMEDLKKLAESKGIEVVGTGKNGAIRKDDYINALK